MMAAMAAVRSFTDAMDRMHGGMRGDMPAAVVAAAHTERQRQAPGLSPVLFPQ